MKFSSFIISLLAAHTVLTISVSAGAVKDLWSKITNTNNKTEDLVKESAPICGSGLFSTPDEFALSPEIIFITNKPSKSEPASGYDRDEGRENYGRNRDRDSDDSSYSSSSRRRGEEVNEVAKEFRFHVENVTMQQLERNGFNPDAPVSFIIHGFTSGYPLQAWITGIVESYTIDRDGSLDDLIEQIERRRSNSTTTRKSDKKVNHNLFIVNWNYAARGINYPRAVANIPIVASYVTRFINEKLLGEAQMDPRRMQLIGHSLGAHLAGYIGKNTQSKLGRIYGLDPAGPCFGSIAGPLFPSSKRLAPTDAEEVITVHTNTAFLGIDKSLGKYSVYVEGGASQPGCKDGGVLKSLSTMTWDGKEFDQVSCSHGRAPNLLTYRLDQTDDEDDCQLVAYECEDWDSYVAGQCGNCRSGRFSHIYSHLYFDRPGAKGGNPLQPVDCLRVGLDWQYPRKRKPSQDSSTSTTADPYYYKPWQRPTTSSRPSSGRTSTTQSSRTTESDDRDFSHYPYSRKPSSSRRPSYYDDDDTTSGYDEYYEREIDTTPRYKRRSSTTRKPYSSSSYSSSIQRDRRAVREETDDIKPKAMFLKTSDTQPYCVFQYQVILELNEPFKRESTISIVLQDSEKEKDDKESASTSSGKKTQQNSLSHDDFGNKFNDTIYTHLLTSSKKLGKVDHATLLFNPGLGPNGSRYFKALHVNYMSHIDRSVRRRLSSRLCPVKTETDRSRSQSFFRFYFEPCEDSVQNPSLSPSSSSGSLSDLSSDEGRRSTSRRPSRD